MKEPNRETDKSVQQIALDLASQSPCTKRKVGAVIVDANNKVLGCGYNYSPNSDSCEDAAGATRANVIHAEVAAIEDFQSFLSGVEIYQLPLTMHTTHAPCSNCRAAIEKAGIANIKVVETFLKFDTDKLRYDLIPVDWHEGDAEILTFGAKKYKPNNWREADDIGRYFAALERHLMACKKAYEQQDSSLLYDKETKLHHMKHLRTNAGFLLTLLKDNINETKD